MDIEQQHECFERWMADHIAILYRVVNGFAEGDDRNDLMQEVMLAVWHAIPRFRAESKPTTFLYRFSHNAALSWRRTRHTIAGVSSRPQFLPKSTHNPTTHQRTIRGSTIYMPLSAVFPNWIARSFCSPSMASAMPIWRPSTVLRKATSARDSTESNND